MSERAHRLNRLVELRSKLHDVASIELRAANGALANADAEVQKSLQRSIDARDAISESLRQGDQEEWMLASADAELSKLGIVNSAAMRAQAAEVAKTAAAQEAEARRERKQMEMTLESLRKKEDMLAVRAEQQNLDEAARLLSVASSKSPFSRRST